MTAQTVDPPRRGPVDPATCKHPPERQFWWWARDDTVPGGQVLCGACCVCGAVLRGGVEDDAQEEAQR